MADDKADSRALDLCALGLGQGGGNLAAEWRRRGYRALLLNTARADFRALGHHEGLDVPSKYTIDIALEGSDGAGRDPEYGRACVRAHADDIRAAVDKQLAGADGLMVCAGLGGGTGSACSELVKILEDLEVPIVTVTTLPSMAESGITKVNAVKAVNHLVSAPLSGRVFIDNERLMEAFPELDVVTYFPSVNARVLSPLDELNRLNRRSDLWSIRSFDSEDLRKVLLSGGVLQTHVARLREDAPLGVEEIVEVVEACVSGGAHLAQGLALEDVAYLALVIVGPEKALRSTSMHVFDEAIRAVKERSGGGAVYEGLYVAPDDGPLKAYVLSASLRLPARISSLLGEAQSEGRELQRKIQEEIPELEISPLEGLELFRAPSRRARPARERPRAPEPRALPEQLEGELPTLSKLKRKTRPKAAAILDAAEPAAEEAEANLNDPLEAPTVETSRAKETAGPTADARPRVGTGRYDEEEARRLEPTLFLDDKGREARVPDRPRTRSKASALAPRVGTGKWDEEGEGDVQGQEPTAMVERPSAEAVPRLAAPDSEQTEAIPPAKGAPAKPATGGAPLLPDDAQVDYDLDEHAFEIAATGTGARELHPAIDDEDDSPVDKTRTDAMLPSFLKSSVPDAGLSSVVNPSGTELQAIYEDLIDRFRQAPDRRSRERVARRLIDDALADDIEIRALAVWAMVKLGDAGFKRALVKARSDENAEISKLAASGLERLG